MFSCTVMEGVARTAAMRDCMMAAPAISPRTRTMRRSEWAASRDCTRWPSRSLSKGTPKLKRSRTRSPASRAMPSVIASSTMPPPAASVSAVCFSGVSPSAIAAAMPPCAQAEDAPSPRGDVANTVTGRGLSLSAQNRPARPPPTMTTEEVIIDRAQSCVQPRRGLYRQSPDQQSLHRGDRQGYRGFLAA